MKPMKFIQRKSRSILAILLLASLSAPVLELEAFSLTAPSQFLTDFSTRYFIQKVSTNQQKPWQKLERKPSQATLAKVEEPHKPPVP